ncbi:DUF3237 family protein [Oceanobacter mangrovi]|uniref:DUF3237 family protein n=1 Tax=Oceanobacter mangrovi TaxID=2862510 RepID=UPI001C8F1A54|nr:DUF3237 family protein [Oceanobacter mangrovi]
MTPDIEKRLTAADDSNRFEIELAFRLYVEIGAEEIIGKTHDGFRRNYPITGGTFIGPDGMRGRVIGSGADISLERHDGVTELDAVYRIETDDGVVIVIDNKGIWRKAEAQDHSADGHYLRTVPRFKAPQGKYEWLNKSVFVGMVDDFSDNALIVSMYRLFGA